MEIILEFRWRAEKKSRETRNNKKKSNKYIVKWIKPIADLHHQSVELLY